MSEQQFILADSNPELRGSDAGMQDLVRLAIEHDRDAARAWEQVDVLRHEREALRKALVAAEAKSENYRGAYLMAKRNLVTASNEIGRMRLVLLTHNLAGDR